MVKPSEVNIQQLVELLLVRAYRERASDIHIEPRSDKVRVRFRIDGVLFERTPIVVEHSDSVVRRLKILAQLDITEQRLPQDGGFEAQTGKHKTPFRIATFPTEYGEKVVLRLLASSREAPRIDQLGYGAAREVVLKRIVNNSEGIVLVTGPTGSGKTTSMYAMLRELESAERNIVTLEDPIEYRFDSIIQGQINTRVGFTFAKGLRHILRQDPDVIMVGEMRDYETAETAFKASLTGHLVFSSLHTNSVADTFVRLLDMGLERFVVASALRAVIAQRLLRRVCLMCRSPSQLLPEHRPLLEGQTVQDGQVIYNPKGCGDCNGTGYVGRIGIFEILEVDEELADMLKFTTLTRTELKTRLREKGVVSLRECGMEQVLKGETTIEEVLRVT